MPVRAPSRSVSSRSRRALPPFAFLYFAALLLAIAFAALLWRSGRLLVHSDPFERAPWAVQMAGETRDCERSDESLRLWRDGRIDTLLVSGCRIFKDKYASAYTADYLAGQGYPRSLLFEFPQDAYSTLEEAALLVREFRALGLDTVLVITVNFHTARTRRIFRALAQENPVVLVHAAPFGFYDPDAFWVTREGLKAWLLEWAKTAMTAWELLSAKPVEEGFDSPRTLPNPRDPDARREEVSVRPLPPPEPEAPPAASADSAMVPDSAQTKAEAPSAE